MSARDRHARQLERAGYVHLSMWLPEERVESLRNEYDICYRAEVERIRAEPPSPKGWPKGKPRKERTDAE